MTDHRPIRICTGCGQKKDKSELLRIVRTPALEILIDPEAMKPGRGAYVCYDEACLERAIKERRIERVLKAHVQPGHQEELRRGLGELLRRRISRGG